MASVSRSAKGRDGYGQRSDVTIGVTGLGSHSLGLREHGFPSFLLLFFFMTPVEEDVFGVLRRDKVLLNAVDE